MILLYNFSKCNFRQEFANNAWVTLSPGTQHILALTCYCGLDPTFSICEVRTSHRSHTGEHWGHSKKLSIGEVFWMCNGQKNNSKSKYHEWTCFQQSSPMLPLTNVLMPCFWVHAHFAQCVLSCIIMPTNAAWSTTGPKLWYVLHCNVFPICAKCFSS